MLGAGLSSRISKAMAALLRRRRRRLLRIATPAGSRAPWSELPPDLLLLVLSRLPSYADRVSLRAVCRPWRSAARLQPPPSPFAWLFVRADTFLALPEGALHRTPLDLSQILLRVPTATGRMFFLVHRDGSCYLMNPSSGENDITPLHIDSSSLKIDTSCRSFNWIRKVVVSDRIVAVPYCGMVTIFPRMASPGARLCWVPPAMYPAASTHVDTDIALFQGELYVVLINKQSKSGSELPELHRLEIGDDENSVRSVRRVRGTPRNRVDDPGLPARPPTWTSRNGVDRTWRSVFYLVACGERLLMVERRTLAERFVVWEGATRECGSRPIRTQLEVWEGVDLTGGHGRWSKVDTLTGHALFVSRGCSQSLPAARCGAREDCIYFVMTERPSRFLPGRKREPQDDVLRCVVYNVRDRTMEPLETTAPTVSPWEPTWFFPADA